MATKKKVFVGSVFEFSQLGANEVISNFKDAHDDPEGAPFVTFDSATQTFSAEVDPEDKDTMAHLIRRVAGYTQYYQTHQPGFDDEPRLHPIEGTVMEDIMRDDSSDDNGLLEYRSDDESDNEDPLKSLQHLTAYWKPRSGDLTILLPMYAQEISRLTGTDIFAEEAEKRYRLYQGNFNLAREKLLRLEPLLETFKKQQNNQSLIATGNLLVWPPSEKDAKLQFVHITSDHPAYSRIIVNKMEQTLFRKVVGEIRLITPEFDYKLPANLYLDGISPTSQVEASRIWNGFLFTSFGDPNNMEPVISSNPTSAENSERGTVKDPEEERITAWTNKVISGANPDIAPEAPVEPTHPPRRRVVLDSDSEDDEPSKVPQAAGLGAPASMAISGQPMPRTTSPEPSLDLVSLLSSPARSVSKQLVESTLAGDLAQESLTAAMSARPGSQVAGHGGPEISSDLLSLLSSSPPSTTMQAIETLMAGKSAGSMSAQATALYDELTGLDSFPANLQPPLATTDKAQTEGRELTNWNPHLSRPLVQDQTSEVSSAEKLSQQELDTTSVKASPALVAATAGPTLDKPQQPAVPTPPLSTPVTPPRPATAEAPSSRPAFNPNGYGGPSPKLRRGQTVHPGGRGGNNSRSRAHIRGGRGVASGGTYAQAISGVQQPTQRGSHLQRGGSFRGSAAGRGSPRRVVGPSSPTEMDQNDLVDASAPVGSTAPRIPPGFEAHVPLVRAPIPQRSPAPSLNSAPNIMDEPIQTGGLAHTAPASLSRSGTTSGESRIRFSNEGADYQATHIPKINQSFMREKSLRLANEAIEARKKAQSQGQGNKKATDEGKPPIHSTMRQQGKNPGKKPVKQETKAEAAARRAQALLDAHGPVPVKVPQNPQKIPNAESQEMSKWKKQQLRKNATVAEGHPEIVEDMTRSQQCDKLVPQLEPLFEICRAFNGRLSFEIAFGQVLIFPDPRLSDQHYHTVADWESLFAPKPTKSPCSTTFTKILTTNGADVDRALELKGPATHPAMKLWNTPPVSQSVSYEFSCQSRSNEDFLIRVDESGRHELLKGLATVGMINIHVPAQVWDAAAIISGHLKWFEPPEVLQKSAATFVKSLYVVPDRERLMIVFRQPNDHEVQVRNLLVKRVSHHACNLPGYEDIQLKVVESKSLMFKVHPQDKKLWQGYEATKQEYRNLSEGGRVHYEMSVVHTGISQILAQNENLEIGELTPAETTGRSLVDRDVIRSMLDVAVHMVSKIDFVGMHNLGTQVRLDMEEEQRRRQLEATLGPRGKSILNAPTRIGMAPVSRVQPTSQSGYPLKAGSGEAAGAGIALGTNSHLATVVKPPVHGVRMNTVAEIFEDPDGSRYMFGMGGARIPVAGDPQPSSSTVMPDDSASQVGGARQSGFYTPWSNNVPRSDGFW